MNDKVSLLIAIPTYETVSTETFESVYNLWVPSHISNTYLRFVKGYDCAKARNEIGKAVLSGKHDYVLMVDSDIAIPENTLVEMFEPDPPDILLGLYPRHSNKDETVLYRPGGYNDENRLRYSDILDSERRLKLRGGGLGCALIRSRVFEMCEYPWFKYEDKGDIGFLSEDLYFCSKARRNGAEIAAATTVKCGHKRRGFDW